MVEFAKPAFNPGDVVYLRNSAALGFIEAYRVVHAKFIADGSVTYVLDTSVKSPTVATFGDMVGPPRYGPLEIIESDLLNYCDAIDLAVTHHQRTLSALQARQASICGDT